MDCHREREGRLGLKDLFRLFLLLSLIFFTQHADAFINRHWTNELMDHLMAHDFGL